MKKKELMGVIIIFSVLFLVVLTWNGSTAYAASKSYKVGHMNPFTGTNSEFGLMFQKTSMMTVEELNAAGGINGVPLEVIYEDNMADPNKGVAAFNKLALVDKVPMIFAAWSGIIQACAPLANSHKTLLVNVAANSPLIRDVSGKYVISTFPLADLDIKLLTQYLFQKKGLKKGACLYINNATGRLNAKVFKDTMEGLGGSIVAFESHEPDAMEFGAQLAKIKAAKPDVLHIPSLNQETPRIVKQARELGIDCQLTCYSIAEGQEMLKTAAMASDGLIYTTMARSSDDPNVKEYLAKYEKKYGKPPVGSMYSMYTYDLIRTIIPATISYMEAKKMPYTGTSCRDAMMAIRKFDTKLTGPTIIQDDQTVIKEVYLKRINAKENKFEFIELLGAGKK